MKKLTVSFLIAASSSTLLGANNIHSSDIRDISRLCSESDWSEKLIGIFSNSEEGCAAKIQLITKQKSGTEDKYWGKVIDDQEYRSEIETSEIETATYSEKYQRQTTMTIITPGKPKSDSSNTKTLQVEKVRGYTNISNKK